MSIAEEIRMLSSSQRLAIAEELEPVLRASALEICDQRELFEPKRATLRLLQGLIDELKEG